jgi:hypothetical protein
MACSLTLVLVRSLARPSYLGTHLGNGSHCSTGTLRLFWLAPRVWYSHKLWLLARPLTLVLSEGLARTLSMIQARIMACTCVVVLSAGIWLASSAWHSQIVLARDGAKRRLIALAYAFCMVLTVGLVRPSVTGAHIRFGSLHIFGPYEGLGSICKMGRSVSDVPWLAREAWYCLSIWLTHSAWCSHWLWLALVRWCS